MSRFQQLSAAFLKSREDLAEYKEDCRKFAGELLDRLLEYLEVLPSHFQLITVDPGGVYQPVIPMSKAMLLVEENYWYFGVALALGYSSEVYKNELTVMHLFVKKEQEQYLARLGMEGKPYPINRTDPHSWETFFQSVYEETLQGFQEEMEDFVRNRQEGTKKIGFMPRLEG